jgi:hypothetical protein
MALLLLYLPIFGSQYLPVEWRAPLTPVGGQWGQVVLGLAIVLELPDGCLLAAALARFRRTRLILV